MKLKVTFSLLPRSKPQSSPRRCAANVRVTLMSGVQVAEIQNVHEMLNFLKVDAWRFNKGYTVNHMLFFLLIAQHSCPLKVHSVVCSLHKTGSYYSSWHCTLNFDRLALESKPFQGSICSNTGLHLHSFIHLASCRNNLLMHYLHTITKTSLVFALESVVIHHCSVCRPVKWAVTWQWGQIFMFAQHTRMYVTSCLLCKGLWGIVRHPAVFDTSTWINQEFTERSCMCEHQHVHHSGKSGTSPCVNKAA